VTDMSRSQSNHEYRWPSLPSAENRGQSSCSDGTKRATGSLHHNTAHESSPSIVSRRVAAASCWPPQQGRVRCSNLGSTAAAALRTQCSWRCTQPFSSVDQRSRLGRRSGGLGCGHMRLDPSSMPAPRAYIGDLLCWIATIP